MDNSGDNHEEDGEFMNGFGQGFLFAIFVIVVIKIIVSLFRRSRNQLDSSTEVQSYVNVNPNENFAVINTSLLPFPNHQFQSTPIWAPSAFNVHDDQYWTWVRNQYALSYERIYLNTGGLGPATKMAINTQVQVQASLQSTSDTGHNYFQQSRIAVAPFVGADVEEVCFTRNATESTSIVASGLGLQAGDEVILNSHSHPGGSFAWLNLYIKYGVIVKIFDPSPISSQDNIILIKSLITPRTKVIQVDYVTAPTGIVFPVKEIATLAHQYGLWCHVDAAQALGMINIDFHELGVDSLSASCHKWLGAPHGTGILLIKKSELDRVKPVEIGAYCDNGYNLPNYFTYNPTAVRYEYGTRDASSVAAIATAVSFMKSVGMEKVTKRGRELATYLQKRLNTIPGVTVLTPTDPTMYASITTFQVEQVPYDELFGFLLSNYKLRLRPVSERGLNALRASTHIFNFTHDCDLIYEGIVAAINHRSIMGPFVFRQTYLVPFPGPNEF